MLWQHAGLLIRDVQVQILVEGPHGIVVKWLSQQTFNLPIPGSSPGGPTIRKHSVTATLEQHWTWLVSSMSRGARKSRAVTDSSAAECFLMVLRWPWCNGSTRLCESRSMGSIPIGQPSLVIWRRRMRTGFISRGGRIDTFYHHQIVLFGNSVMVTLQTLTLSF